MSQFDTTSTVTSQLTSVETTELLDHKNSEAKVDVAATTVVPSIPAEAAPVIQYRLYKRRWLGLTALCLLNLVAGMIWPWFGPIALPTAKRFNISVTRVNWLSNILNVVYLPMAFAIPPLIGRVGVRNACFVGSVALVFSSWIRYAGTSGSLSDDGAFTLLLLGQGIAGIAQPIFQVLAPKFSELWFNHNGRVTATMLISIANPLGSGVGQILSPIFSDPKNSILLLGILCTAVAPLTFLIQARPPTPPTHAASTPSPPMLATFRATIGKERPGEPSMHVRERIDFIVLTFVFGVCVGATSAFSILSNEILAPYGYSSTEAGLMGAVLLFSGILAAIVFAPILDKVLTHHLSPAIRILTPCLGVGWLGLIFAARAGDAAGIFIVMVLIGVCSLTLLPVALELGCEVTRDPETSSSMMWFSGNMFAFIFVPVQTALQAGSDADPPNNFHRSLIFGGCCVIVASSFVFGIRGKQIRREQDVEKSKEISRNHELGPIRLP